MPFGKLWDFVMNFCTYFFTDANVATKFIWYYGEKNFELSNAKWLFSNENATVYKLEISGHFNTAHHHRK